MIVERTKGRREAFRFMLAHAGYATPPGRAACALELARSEAALRYAADDDRASVEWLDDDEAYDPGDFVTAEEARAKFESGEWIGPFGCVVRCGEAVESLWGIVLAGYDDPYRRVVEAELASGLKSALDCSNSRAIAGMLGNLGYCGVPR